MSIIPVNKLAHRHLIHTNPQRTQNMKYTTATPAKARVITSVVQVKATKATKASIIKGEVFIIIPVPSLLFLCFSNPFFKFFICHLIETVRPSLFQSAHTSTFAMKVFIGTSRVTHYLSTPPIVQGLAACVRRPWVLTSFLSVVECGIFDRAKVGWGDGPLRPVKLGAPGRLRAVQPA